VGKVAKETIMAEHTTPTAALADLSWVEGIKAKFGERLLNVRERSPWRA